MNRMTSKMTCKMCLLIIQFLVIDRLQIPHTEMVMHKQVMVPYLHKVQYQERPLGKQIFQTVIFNRVADLQL